MDFEIKLLFRNKSLLSKLNFIFDIGTKIGLESEI